MMTDKVYIKQEKKHKANVSILLTVTVDNACLSSNWRIVSSIFPFVCSIIINGIIDDEDLRWVKESKTPLDILPNVRKCTDKRSG
jgi:hypothetical protein